MLQEEGSLGEGQAHGSASQMLEGSIDLELLQSISLAVAQAHDVQTVLKMIVSGLVEKASCTLACIWLTAPGDICERCSLRTECPDQTQCLHLVASVAKPKSKSSGEAWHRMDGDFQRFPLNVRIIGRIGATGCSEHRLDTTADKEWIGRDDWMRREGIRTFVGHPLQFRGEILGVLGVFTREHLGTKKAAWLRLFADHAATAIANARAFEEIERLQGQLKLENEYLREEVKIAHGFGEIVGQSRELRKVLDQVGLVGPADTSVLICGESGAGKELVARAIHECSSRRDRPLITVNCASVPRELFESEFFGHTKGAFTGAIRDRLGRFELADGGTLFLEEVGEIPLELQGKLLRVLQEGTFERLGDERTRTVDVRIIAASNRDLKQEIEAGRFRHDLYYRLTVFPIEVAPVRERLEDLPVLAAHLLERICSRLGVAQPKLLRRHIEVLQRYEWPGNVRELQNLLERAVITAQSGNLEFDLKEGGSEREKAVSAEKIFAESSEQILNYDELKRRERENLRYALESTYWKISGPAGAANFLGIKPTTLASKIKALGLRRE